MWLTPANSFPPSEHVGIIFDWENRRASIPSWPCSPDSQRFRASMRLTVLIAHRFPVFWIIGLIQVTVFFKNCITLLVCTTHFNYCTVISWQAPLISSFHTSSDLPLNALKPSTPRLTSATPFLLRMFSLANGWFNFQTRSDRLSLSRVCCRCVQTRPWKVERCRVRTLSAQTWEEC